MVRTREGEHRLNSESRVISAVFALTAFGVAIACGLWAGNETGVILFRAVVAMIVCQCVGTVAGSMVERIVAEHAESYKALNQVPEVPVLGAASDGVVIVDEHVDESARLKSNVV